MTTPSTGPGGEEARGRRSLFFAVLALALMGAIFWISSRPAPPVVPNQILDVLVKKTGHFGAYALLAALCWSALQGRMTPRLTLAVAFTIAAGYAWLDEIHQVFTPTRAPSVVDVGIDALGAALSLWLITRWRRRWHRQRRSP